jgi:hypothetical protein
MMHSESTQQRVYNKCTDVGKKVRISNIMQKIMTKKALNEEDLAPAAYG